MAFASICLYLLVLSAPAQAQENAWQKFVSRDQKFSFQVPAGWRVEESVSTVTIAQASTGEELLVIALPFDRGKSPGELAAPIFAALRAQMPELLVELVRREVIDQLREDGAAGKHAQLSAGEGGVAPRAEGSESVSGGSYRKNSEQHLCY
jgi:hypothetical protein